MSEPLSRVYSRPPAPTESVTVKGFYLRALLRELGEHGHTLPEAPSYRDFGDYPLSLAHALLLECARRLYPGEPRKEALRRLGWIIYPTLLSTVIGRVIFGSLGEDLGAVLKVAGRGFEVSLSEGRYELVRIDARGALLRVRSFHLFPESFLPGVFEGLLAHYGHADAEVVATLVGSADVDITLRW